MRQEGTVAFTHITASSVIIQIMIRAIKLSCFSSGLLSRLSQVYYQVSTEEGITKISINVFDYVGKQPFKKRLNNLK